MARELNDKESQNYIANRTDLHYQLSELQADFEDLSDNELIECRKTILNRINVCLELILETDEDNIDKMQSLSDKISCAEEQKEKSFGKAITKNNLDYRGL